MKLQDKISLWYAGNAHKLNKATLEESVHKDFLIALQKLEAKILDVYYTDIVRQGAKKAWSVDLSNDEINRQCGLTWTWTIITKKMIEGTDLAPRPWLIVINNCSFPLPVIESIVNTWAIEKGYKFNIRIKKHRG
ncbi:MAG: hypothetical protein ABSB95_11810 [Dissulfurispiraceae bacterium]|jgi:hypothetical protein